jgi:Dolichyl-phosphate-mannose-protein mannosyltransferase
MASIATTPRKAAAHIAPGIRARNKERLADLIAWQLLLAGAMGIATYRCAETGGQWPDSACYANAGAMIHDWLRSGSWLHPYEFAKQNYRQYPAFALPYHPPAYPGLLGIFFSMFGMSYFCARLFVGICYGLLVCFFYAIIRKLGLRPIAALACSILFATTSDVVRWGRDTMSEVPASLLIMVGTLFFLNWLELKRTWMLWAAFAFAEIAFLSRVTTCAILPAWLIYASSAGHIRLVFSRRILSLVALFVITGGAFVWIVGQFSDYELRADGRGSTLFWGTLSYFPAILPQLGRWGSVFAGLLGIAAVSLGKRGRLAAFWLAWLLSCLALKALVPTSQEVRHFFLALPAFAGLAGCLLDPLIWKRATSSLGLAIVGLGVSANIYQDSQLPLGIVGYNAVAKVLAQMEPSGNILAACPEEADLIFRYRCLAPKGTRQILRADRTLAIRLPNYAGVAPAPLAQSTLDVVEVVRRGRIRFVLTCAPDDNRKDDRPADTALAHETVMSLSSLFRAIANFDLLVDFGGGGRHHRIFLWEYQGELPEGPSELPVVIPTAKLTL